MHKVNNLPASQIWFNKKLVRAGLLVLNIGWAPHLQQKITTNATRCWNYLKYNSWWRQMLAENGSKNTRIWNPVLDEISVGFLNIQFWDAFRSMLQSSDVLRPFPKRSWFSESGLLLGNLQKSWTNHIWQEVRNPGRWDPATNQTAFTDLFTSDSSGNNCFCSTGDTVLRNQTTSFSQCLGLVNVCCRGSMFKYLN